MNTVLSDIPMPPSCNAQYAARTFYDKKTGKRFSKLCPTNDLVNYKKQFNNWAIVNSNAIKQLKSEVNLRMGLELKLYLNIIFYFRKEEIFTKKNTTKKMDVSNRIKAIHDCISNVLEIDDKEFFGGSFEKRVAKNSYCTAFFYFIDAVTSDENKGYIHVP